VFFKVFKSFLLKSFHIFSKKSRENKNDLYNFSKEEILKNKIFSLKFYFEVANFNSDYRFPLLKLADTKKWKAI
jgi:hypothetical protein